jgi:hypothetical protein
MAHDWHPYTPREKPKKAIPDCLKCGESGEIQRSLTGPMGFAIYRVAWPCCALFGPVGAYYGEAIETAVSMQTRQKENNETQKKERKRQ